MGDIVCSHHHHHHRHHLQREAPGISQIARRFNHTRAAAKYQNPVVAGSAGLGEEDSASCPVVRWYGGAA